MKLWEQIYVGGAVVVAVAACLLAAVPTVPTANQLLVLWMMVVLAAVAQFFEVKITEQRSYFPHNVFFFAGVLLLPPLLLPVLFTIPLTLEAWRYHLRGQQLALRWYDLIFNIAIHTLTGLAAHWVYFATIAHLADLVQIGQVFAAVIAATTYVLGNHVIFRLADVLINQISWRESAIWMTENLFTELVMAYLGYVVAVLWLVNPVMVLPMLGLMMLLQKALMIPKLQHEAQTDSKTGLLNVRYFNQQFDELLERAKRLNRPLSIMMADLDFLRRINNNYGHLAGDLVLIGVSKIIANTVRNKDIVGRFGGEEFAILLPDTDQEEAFEVAEAIRAAIEAHRFDVPTSQTPLQTTMSLGVACFPEDATTATDLLHQADVAVYQAKMDGRNRVTCAADLFYRIDSRLPAETGSESKVEQPTAPLLLEPRARLLPAVIPKEPPYRPVLPAWYGWLSETLIKSGVIAVALVMTLVGFIWQSNQDWGAVLLLMGLTAGAQFLRVKLFTSGELSIAAALIFGAALLTGLPGLVLVSAVIVLTSALSMENLDAVVDRRYELAYDWAVGVFAGLVPALLMGIFTIPLTFAYLPLLIVPCFLMALAYSYMGPGLIALTVSITTQTDLARIWHEEFRQSPPQYLLLSVIGFCFAIAYTMFGAIGLLLCVLPIFVLRLGQEPLLAQMNRSLSTFVKRNLLTGHMAGKSALYGETVTVRHIVQPMRRP